MFFSLLQGITQITLFVSKGQRTVYRLTLVKSFNTTELDEYAQLVKLGEPDFIEVKVCLIICFNVHKLNVLQI